METISRCILDADKSDWQEGIFANTVELRWLKLVGTVGVSSTHPCVRAIPSLTIFKLVHVYFMSSRTPRFLSPKVAKRTWNLSLINNPLHARVKMISRMCKHMNLLKVNTFISMRICAGWSMHLLWSKLYRLSSCGWMFLFICRYSLCLVVYRFL